MARPKRNQQVAVIATYVMHPEDAPVALGLMQAAMRDSREEPGCLAYVFSRDLEESATFHLLELWQDTAAFDAHARRPHVAAFAEGMGRLRVQRTLSLGDFVPAIRP